MDLNELGEAISQLTLADLESQDEDFTEKCKSVSCGLKNMLHRFSYDFDLFSFYYNADFFNSATKQELAKLQSSLEKIEMSLDKLQGIPKACCRLTTYYTEADITTESAKIGAIRSGSTMNVPRDRFKSLLEDLREGLERFTKMLKQISAQCVDRMRLDLVTDCADSSPMSEYRANCVTDLLSKYTLCKTTLK